MSTKVVMAPPKVHPEPSQGLSAYDGNANFQKGYYEYEMQQAIEECRQNGWLLQELRTIVDYRPDDSYFKKMSRGG